MACHGAPPQRPSKLSQACWCVFPWRCGQFDRVVFHAESRSHAAGCRLVLWLGVVRARRTCRGCIKGFDSSSRTNSDFLMRESLLSRCRLRHTVPSWVVAGIGRTCRGFKCCGASIFLRSSSYTQRGLATRVCGWSNWCNENPRWTHSPLFGECIIRRRPLHEMPPYLEGNPELFCHGCLQSLKSEFNS